MSARDDARAVLDAKPHDRALRVERALLERLLAELEEHRDRAEAADRKLGSFALLHTPEQEQAARAALMRQRRRWLRRQAAAGAVPLGLMPPIERDEALEDAMDVTT